MRVLWVAGSGHGSGEEHSGCSQEVPESHSPCCRVCVLVAGVIGGYALAGGSTPEAVNLASASGLSCSGLVTTPAEVVEEGLGFGGDAGLGGYLLGADGDGC